jgi:hypothetical protein
MWVSFADFSMHFLCDDWRDQAPYRPPGRSFSKLQSTPDRRVEIQPFIPQMAARADE